MWISSTVTMMVGPMLHFNTFLLLALLDIASKHLLGLPFMQG